MTTTTAPKVTASISMSLDGIITDPLASAGTPLHGHDPGRLHDWQFASPTDADHRVVDELYASTGAVVIGRRMFDVGFEPWGDPPPFERPVFVLTHEHRDPLPMQGGTTYHFAAGGIEECLDQARAAAAGKDVSVWGGGQTLSECLRRGLLDELEIHLVPIILGEGIRLFQGPELGNVALQKTRCIETPGAMHLRFQVARG